MLVYWAATQPLTWWLR